MAAQTPCPACSWIAERQNGCNYHSKVKLFYSVSDRGVWSLGSRLILKERSPSAPNLEARNMRFVSTNTTLPVPEIVDEWNEDASYFVLTRRIPGESLNKAWPSLSAGDKDRIARQTADEFGKPHGPFASDAELWADMEAPLTRNDVPEKARRRLQQRMPAARPYTFTHGDLTNVNIMVQDGRLTGILDWEASGYFPVWWEYTAAGIGLGEEDAEWKALLRKYLRPECEDAREVFRDYFVLCSSRSASGVSVGRRC
ncbi:kinase-like protein [Myriangium duriaei CBS 260.36]|uniref:Kinase-like protein n=1 Tax=Myriangium duriaei CBS 260.36 TaxID=1168546 RepID=A0A9P4J5V4_9PEZI|nr:kinase-like protein [Myriangium duriaei CBS 260.36]